MYSTDKDALYVNMYAGGRVTVGEVAGTKVEIEQVTDYPWRGKVTIIVRPAEERRFDIHLRLPSCDASRLYTSSATTDDNMQSTDAYLQTATGNIVQRFPINVSNNNGYLVVSKKWKEGDQIELDLPLAPQRIKANERVTADRGRVALRYGPLIYCIESVDQNVDSVLPPNAPLTTEWRPDLLGGVVVIKGKFADGKPMLAVPYYARANRGGRFVVWIRDK